MKSIFTVSKNTYSILIALVIVMSLTITSCLWDETDITKTSDNEEYLVLNDSEYPYAGLPRMVIETEDYEQIRDVTTLHSAKMQIYGEKEPTSSVINLTVRGRGNSSAKMPKYGLKLELNEKQSMFNMPANRDWVLIANFGEKTHIRNHMIFRLSHWLNASYTPEDQYVELYLNRKYMGLYLFTENVKVSKNRVNIPENNYSFLFEKETPNKVDTPYVTTSNNYSYHVKSPKNPSAETLKLLENHLNDVESYLVKKQFHNDNPIESWIDMESYFLQYWLQEFSKNEDGGFSRSIFMTWLTDTPIHFGPIWDLDLGFGNESQEENRSPEGWYIRKFGWHSQIFSDQEIVAESASYWKEHKEYFRAIIDSIPVYVAEIREAIENEYKRWPILTNTERWALKKPYNTYEEAVEDLTDWTEKRYQWINSNLD